MMQAVTAKPERKEARRTRGLCPARHRVRPIRALRAVRALIANPEATGEVFMVIEALKGDSLARAVVRLHQSESGRGLLEGKPRLLESLNARERLRAMPAGSLGRAYLEFVESQQLSADGLVAASEEAPRWHYLGADERWLADRLRDIHDLQHVLTGYGRDEVGEFCLLSFMTGQTCNRGISFIVFMGRRDLRRKMPALPIDACVEEGRRIAKAARWLAAVRWEACLAGPLDQLRQTLGLQPASLYQKTRERWPAASPTALS
jgi:ubiquinone biosynthesis protein COQ4